MLFKLLKFSVAAFIGFIIGVYVAIESYRVPLSEYPLVADIQVMMHLKTLNQQNLDDLVAQYVPINTPVAAIPTKLMGFDVRRLNGNEVQAVVYNVADLECGLICLPSSIRIVFTVNDDAVSSLSASVSSKL